MQIDAYNKNKEERKLAKFFKVLDLDTGKYIEHVICANQETGEYEIFEYKEDVEWDIFRERPKTIKQKGNIVLVYRGEV